MFDHTKAFSSFAVDDIAAARRFYADVLGIEVEDHEMGFLTLALGDGPPVLVYPRPGHEPAAFTVLNFPVEDIAEAVDELSAKGVEMTRYEGFDQDERGIARNPAGPPIAWFTDPAGNVIAVVEGSA